MNTPAHMLLGAAVSGQRIAPRTSLFGALGGLAPDLSLYLLAGTSLFVLGIPPQTVFDELYFSQTWQSIFAVDNSFVVWLLGLVAASSLRNAAATAFAGAGLLHLATDFPLHNDDARRHFWPLSDWVFQSPLSYWDSAHHAAMIAPVTLIAVLAAALVVWRRHTEWWSRLSVAAACALEIWVVRQWLLYF